MLVIQDITRVLDAFAPAPLAEGYDNAGLLTGNPHTPCQAALCTLDVTREVLREAKEKNCNLVVAHHPIIFSGLKSITGKNYVEQVIIEAIRNDIAIYAAHTNMDNVLLGVNGKIAEKLGLTDISILSPKQKMLRRLITFAPNNKANEVRKAVFAAGAGHIGQYSDCSFNSKGVGTFKAEKGADPYVGEIGKLHEEQETKIEIVYPFYLEGQVVKALIDNHPYEEVAYDIFTMENVHWGIGSGVLGQLPAPMDERDFLQHIKDTFKCEAIRYTQLTGKKVEKVALCGGSGAFLIKKALGAGADFYITADVKYHEFFDAERKMVIADIGHYESEQFTVELLHDLIAKKFPTFAVLKSNVNTNPIQYFV